MSYLNYIDFLYNASSCSTAVCSCHEDGYIGSPKWKANGDNYELKQLVAGFDKERISVKSTERTAKVYLDFDSKNKKLITSMEFNHEIDPKRVKAKLSHGILFLTLPKREKSHSINIQVE
jgi:HSP20 family molecular chaperone IbpA